MVRKDRLSKGILAGIMGVLPFILNACDYFKQKNKIQKRETIKEKEFSASSHAERKNYTHKLTKLKSLEYYIAQADSMAAISYYPETSAPKTYN